MKFYKFLYSAMSLAMVAGMTSCSSSEDGPEAPVKTGMENMTSYPVEISLPEEYRTRAAADATVGADGLYTFTRDIDRLWYAVYVDGELLYGSEDKDVEQATKTDTGFALNVKISKEQDPTKVNIFFWAGGKDDGVYTTKLSSPSFNDPGTKIDINYQAGCVTVSPKYLNGDNTAVKEYDSFTGYFQLADTPEPESLTKQFVLKRPFAQIHVLTDELTYPMIAAGYPIGITMRPGFGSVKANADNASANLKNPTTWFYKSSGEYSQNYLWFGQADNYYTFTNKITGNSPERVTFKNRKMDYLGCYLVFAPQTKQTLKDGDTNMDYLNLGFMSATDLTKFTEFSYVKLPAAGLKANERYVIYNHYNDPTNPGGGGGDNPDPDPEDPGNGGFLSNCFTFEIIASPTWDGTVEQEK